MLAHSLEITDKMTNLCVPKDQTSGVRERCNQYLGIVLDKAGIVSTTYSHFPSGHPGV